MQNKGFSRRTFLKLAAGSTAAIFAASIEPLKAAAQEMTYHEAPMLADLVAAGTLPPVEERLPKNPRVITPYKEVGEYGGTWRRAFKGLSDRWGPTKLQEEMVLEWDAFDPAELKLVPNFISEWTQNDDASEFSFTLRDGIKWSDGVPFTTEDVAFNYELIKAQILLQIDHLYVNGQLFEQEIIDDRTWKITFVGPNPLLPITLARTSSGGMIGGPTFAHPKHYLEKFWGDLPNANQDAINKMLEANGMSDWTELWWEGGVGDGRGVANFWFRNPELPVINAWRSLNTPLDDPHLMERNPYYHAVDPEGNQLPYIDRVQHSLFEYDETLNLWIAQGLIDMQTRHLSAANFTFYKENEAGGDYRSCCGKLAGPTRSTPISAILMLIWRLCLTLLSSARRSRLPSTARSSTICSTTACWSRARLRRSAERWNTTPTSNHAGRSITRTALTNYSTASA